MKITKVIGNFKFTLESFGPRSAKLYRPIEVRGKIRRPGKTRRKGEKPIALGSGRRVIDTDGGHIVGLEIGGPDHPYNLIPMYGQLNRGEYREFERAVRNNEGYQRIRVKLTYPREGNGDTRVPMRIMAYVSGVQNRVWEFRNRRPVAAAHEFSADARQFIQNLYNDFRDFDLLERYPHSRFQLPEMNERRYAFLDFVWEEEGLFQDVCEFFGCGDGAVMGGGRVFTDWQRWWIAESNRILGWDNHHGECHTDAAEDPFVGSALTDLGSDSGIHVDHIVARANNGPNAFSNARVTSAAYNVATGRHVLNG